MTILSTNTFLLVPTSENEVEYLWEVAGQVPTWKSMYDNKHDFLSDIYGMLNDNTYLVWTVYTKQGRSSKKAGVVFLSNVAYGLSARIHGAVDKRVFRKNPKQFKGLADKVLQEIMRYSFNVLGVARLDASFYEKAPSLIKFLKRNGFKRNGILKKSIYVSGEIKDTYIYGILEDDYLKGVNNVKKEKAKLS